MGYEKLRVLDLFSGIGGFSLGLERTGGFRTVAFCEIEPYCRAVLRKHWPGIPCFEDVRSLYASDMPEPIDVICGGFPCQDISAAGEQVGIDGSRSGLWREFARLIGETRPKFCIVENVAALLNRGMGRVLADLAALGYGAEWHCIPASVVDAPHERDRVWIIGYPERKHNPSQIVSAIPRKPWAEARLGELVRISSPAFRSEALAALGGMDDGIPSGLDIDRLRSLGNAVVPQIPEIIGRAILEAEGRE